MTPMAWRAMRNTEMLIGTSTIASPKRGTLLTCPGSADQP
jgi:hypothetical protein